MLYLKPHGEIFKPLKETDVEVWLHCTASAKLTEKMPEEDPEQAEMERETRILACCRLRQALGKARTKDFPDLPLAGAEMEDIAQQFADYVCDVYRKEFPFIARSGGEAGISGEFPYDQYGDKGCLFIAGEELHEIYLDLGDRPAAVQYHPYLMQAAAILLSNHPEVAADHIIMHFVQPKTHTTSVWSVPTKTVVAWKDAYLVPAMQDALSGSGHFSAGKWCCGCRARFNCRTRAAKFALLPVYDEEKHPLLSNAEVKAIQPHAGLAEEWGRDVRKYWAEVLHHKK